MARATSRSEGPPGLKDLPHAGTMFADSAESSNNAIRAPYSMRGAILPAAAVVLVVNGMNPPVEL